MVSEGSVDRPGTGLGRSQQRSAPVGTVRDVLSPPEAAGAHKGLLRLEMDLFPFAPFAERVWELRSNLTSYDAWYVALAEALDCPLVTLDRKLSRAIGPKCEIIAPPRSLSM